MDLKFLKDDEKEIFAELLEHDGLKPLMRLLDAQAAAFEREVLSFDLKVGLEDELIIRKARAEGARRLYTKFLVEVERARQIMLNDPS